MFSRIVYSIILLSVFSILNAQQCKRADIWQFCVGAGIDFSTGMPQSLPVSAQYTESGASICDVNGNLLFYCNGEEIFNKNNTTMLNGDNLNGHNSSSQSALITPFPGDSLKYYIFTTDAFENGYTNGLQYNIVDMRGDGGLGEVILKNQLLIAPACEKVTAAVHANGKDYWVITRGVGSAGGSRLYAYLIDDNGLNTTPVTSLLTSNVPLFPGSAGVQEMKASKDGKTIVAANAWLNPYGSGMVEIYEFDNCTGQVLSYDTLWRGNAYGVSFSPNDSLIYVGKYELKVYERFSSNIPASKRIVGNMTEGGGMQIGPDGKIYISGNLTTDILGVINTPNDINNPDLVVNGFSVAPGGLSYGINNLFTAYVYDCFDKKNVFDFSFNDSVLCPESCITFINNSSSSSVEWSWIFPGGIPTESDMMQPGEVCYPEEGSYEVQLSKTGGACTEPDTISKTINIILSDSCNPDTNILVTDSFSLFIPNAFSPGQTGINNIFNIKATGIINYTLAIYDRYGKMVFKENETTATGWDGSTISGMLAPEDVYLYILEYKNQQSEEQLFQKGNIALIR